MTELRISRRHLLGGALGVGAVAGLSACGLDGSHGPPTTAGPLPSPRPTTGTVRDFTLAARPVQVDLGGRVASTWAYGDAIPGTGLRATAGDRVTVAFTNDLSAPTCAHWHGLAIRNDIDRVPGVTTPEVPPRGCFAFDFVVPDPGTHWLHPHTRLQLDRGLYAPFIIDDPDEPGAYEHEWVLLLDGWIDGVGPSPEEILADLRAAGADESMMGGMGGGMMSSDGGDVSYPLFLITGRPSWTATRSPSTPSRWRRAPPCRRATLTRFSVWPWQGAWVPACGPSTGAPTTRPFR